MKWRRRWCHLAASLLYGNKDVTCGDSYIIVIRSVFFTSNLFHSKPANKIHVIKTAWLYVSCLCKRNTKHMWWTATPIFTLFHLLNFTHEHVLLHGAEVLEFWRIFSFSNRQWLEPLPQRTGLASFTSLHLSKMGCSCCLIVLCLPLKAIL